VTTFFPVSVVVVVIFVLLTASDAAFIYTPSYFCAYDGTATTEGQPILNEDGDFLDSFDKMSIYNIVGSVVCSGFS
jgi:uncharacterized membrane protein